MNQTIVFLLLALIAFTYVSVIHHLVDMRPIQVFYMTPIIRESQSSLQPAVSGVQGQRLPSILVINLAVVSCGTDKLEQAVTMIKSALLFSQESKLRVIAFTDQGTISLFQKYLKKLRLDARTIGLNFVYELRLATFPPEIEGMNISWATVHRPCSVQRLFLPSLLPDIDSLIYMDADALVLSNLTKLWNQFQYMNSSQMIGLTYVRELNLKPQQWFIDLKIPVYQNRGFNSGIALMNLTKMRLVKFEEQIYQVRKDYEHLRPNRTGDQFLQNILYGQHPEYVLPLSCDWNLRFLNCKYYPNRCKRAIIEGVSLLHGNALTFTHKTRVPIFRHIYEIFKVHSFKTDTMTSLLEKLKYQFNLEKPSDVCFFNWSEIFYLKFQKYVEQLDNVRRVY